MGFSWDVRDDLERIGQPQQGRRRGSRREQTVIPASTIAQPKPRARKGKAWHKPSRRKRIQRVRFFRRRFARLQNAMRPCTQATWGQALQIRQRIRLARPTRSQQPSAPRKSRFDKRRQVDFVGSRQINGYGPPQRQFQETRADVPRDARSLLRRDALAPPSHLGAQCRFCRGPPHFAGFWNSRTTSKSCSARSGSSSNMLALSE